MGASGSAGMQLTLFGEAAGKPRAFPEKRGDGERIPARFAAVEISGDRCGIKGEFHRAARRYLKGVEAHLAAQGYLREELSSNMAGPAVSGETLALWFHPERAAGIYVQVDCTCIGHLSLAGNGLCIMYRATCRSDRWGGLANRFARWDLPAAELAARCLEAARFHEREAAARDAARGEGRHEASQAGQRGEPQGSNQ